MAASSSGGQHQLLHLAHEVEFSAHAEVGGLELFPFSSTSWNSRAFCSRAVRNSRVRSSTFFQAQRLLQSAGHVVELIGECFQLVAGLDGDVLGQIADANARRAGPQGLDRPDHALRQEHPGQYRDTERRQQHQA